MSRASRVRPAALVGAMLAALPLGAGLLTPACSPKPRPQPDVLMLVIDTLRADRVGAYGYAIDTTPHLDALAARGLAFENAQATSSWTVASMGSVFTGLPPSAHGFVLEPDEVSTSRIPEAWLTLDEAFRDAGYRTSMTTSQSWVRRSFGFGQGTAEADFDSLFDDARKRVRDEAVTRRLSARLDKVARDRKTGDTRPFFMYGHYMGPHTPYDAPESVLTTLYSSPPPPTPYTLRLMTQGVKAQYDRLLQDGLHRVVSVPDAAWLSAQYDGGVRLADDEIGRVLDLLRKLGLEEGTLVVLLSDHGEAFLEHGTLVHGQHLHEELTHVPLILAGPGVEPGWRGEVVSLQDLMPTLLSLSGVTLPAAQKNSSLVPRRSERPLAYAEYRDDQARLTDNELAYLAYPGYDELYDRKRDPAETRNIASQRPELVLQLRRRADRLRAEGTAAFTRAGAPSALPDPKAREDLKALGYVN